jgi:hypothetical protein
VTVELSGKPPSVRAFCQSKIEVTGRDKVVRDMIEGVFRWLVCVLTLTILALPQNVYVHVPYSKETAKR